MTIRLLPTLVGLTLALSIYVLPASANTLTVTPNPDGTVVMAADEGVDGVARIDLTFSYSTAFSGIRVILQGGDYSPEQVARDSNPGLLRLNVIRDGEEMLNAGFVFIASFDEKPDKQPCAVNFVAATYTYADGRVTSPHIIILPLVAPQNEPDPLLKKKDSAAAPAPVPPDIIRNIPAGEVKGPGPSTAEADGGKKGSSQEAPDTLSYRTCPDILQRFRDYRGERSFAAFVSLFTRDDQCAFEQSPAVAISDGISGVAVTLDAEPSQQDAPNMGLSGARIVSLWRDLRGKWRIELLPNKGEYEVILYVITGRLLRRIPLVVAPPLVLYLKGISPAEKLSPVSEFIITANYLARESAAQGGR